MQTTIETLTRQLDLAAIDLYLAQADWTAKLCAACDANDTPDAARQIALSAAADAAWARVGDLKSAFDHITRQIEERTPSGYTDTFWFCGK